MDYLRVIILGIIEGITEFLPVSSTGHLIIANQFIKLEPQSFSNAFNVIIQLGAIMSVVLISFEKLNPFNLKALPAKLEDRFGEMNFQTRAYYRLSFPDRAIIGLWMKIIVAVLPAVVFGLLLDDIIDAYLFNPYTVAAMLIVWGIIIIIIERGEGTRRSTIDSFSDLSYKSAVFIGLFQCLAMIPGTSRSAATIIGALLLGLNRTLATEFSFYLAIPTMMGATLLKVMKNLSGLDSGQWILILLGSLVSFVVAFLAVKSFLSYVKKNDFKVFGYYRIIVGIAVLVIFTLIK